MGAACTGAKSANVKDTITGTKDLSQQAQEHLKSLKERDPLSDTQNLGESLKNGDFMSSAQKQRGGEEARVVDKDANPNFEEDGERTHEMLWQALEQNDCAAAEKFFDFNDIEESNLYDASGQSMLHKAASLGYAEMLMLLLERTGAKPELANAQLASPLHLACRNNRENVVKFLIGCGVDANCQDEHGQTPILICSIHGNSNLASLLIESSIAGHLPEPLEVDIPDHRGLTPLNCASIKGDLSLVKILQSRGGANPNQTSPKGCTPLIYAGRGGFNEVVKVLLDKRASALKQDNAGGTVLHHAIEKGHINVLETLLEHGVDVYSAIEIADNAGRTPIFEAVENLPEDATDFEMIKILTRKKKEGNGFGAKVNVVNYNGQTPLFSAVREGNFEAVKVLVSIGAKVDLNGGELVKEQEEDEEDEESYDSPQEKLFMEAFKNCMTPLQVASVLGYDEIALYLVENGAKVNLQSSTRKYTALHLAVLANKPEMLIELLTKSNADPLLEDAKGRSLLDLVYQYIPSYVESFQMLLENLQMHRIQTAGSDTQANVATHYHNPDDERKIQPIADIAIIEEQINQASTNADVTGGIFVEDGGLGGGPMPMQNLTDIEEHDIEIEDDAEMDPRIEVVFGRKVAIGLIASNWKYKEMAIKVVCKQTEKTLQKQDKGMIDLPQLVEASMVAVSLTCFEKVIKVFNISLQLFNLIVASSKVDNDILAVDKMRHALEDEGVITKLLTKSEESNTRLTNKIHEALLDLSYHPKVGEDMVAGQILKSIHQHNSSASKFTNYKGLLAQLALLFKMVNSFGLVGYGQSTDSNHSGNVMSADTVLAAVMPAVCHTNPDVKNAAIKILLDVQKLSGGVKNTHLQQLPEKTRDIVREMVFSVTVEREEEKKKRESEGPAPGLGNIGKTSPRNDGSAQLNVVNIGMLSLPNDLDFNKTIGHAGMIVVTPEAFQKYKDTIMEKGSSKDWTQREVALQSMQDCFENVTNRDLVNLIETEGNEDFLVSCTILLKQSLEEKNSKIYLIALQVSSVFFAKSIQFESVIDSLQTLVTAIVLRTTDTNTRVRKKSVDLINQIWDSGAPQSTPGFQFSGKKASGDKEDHISQLIAGILCDNQLGEKAIIGRLGLFIKKALLIESGEDLSKKPLNLILGRDYEQLTEFACQWCTHKDTKVRQGALKLIVEVCRLNHIDPRGQPFKQRIINYILGLRPSLRTPLVVKINEVCAQESKANQEEQNNRREGKGKAEEQFINVNEMELNLATKHRSASLDVRRGREQVRQSNPQLNTGAKPPGLPNGQDANGLPSIGGAGLPGLAAASNAQSAVGPTLVLPHSEPLTDAQQEQAQEFLQLFTKEIMTCFYSQTWSTRQAAILKIEEQLHNLDPKRRDAMYGEINRNNLPPELSFKIFLKLAHEGFKDPVLKNYILILELIQKVLPTYFRYLRPNQIQEELLPIVSAILNKTSDLKSKVREASLNFCLYLSHQSPIGPDVMIGCVVKELDLVQGDKPPVAEKKVAQDKNSGDSGLVTTSFGNTHQIASLLKLLGQFQQQTKIVDGKTNPLFAQFLLCINRALRHQNPQVRKEGEALFKLLYLDFGEDLLKELKNQKVQVVAKLTTEARQELKQSRNDDDQGNASKSETSAPLQRQMTSKEQNEQYVLQRTQTQLREDFLSQPSIRELLKGHEECLSQLKLPNSKKRMRAIVEIKKVIQKKIAQVSTSSARDLLEPLSLLMRQLLKDDNNEVYLESLNLLKFIVASLAPHLTALDLHLMMGSFIGVIVNNTVTGTMRIRMASDKVIIFFAKNNNIGSFIVAKEVLKNIERINKLVVQPTMSKKEIEEEIEQRKQVLVRHYGILQMLVQQFSIVLCYQPDFYVKCLELIAETMGNQHWAEEPALKSLCTQMIINLHQIDPKLLEAGVAKLDFTKKTPIRKVMIEYDNMTQKGKGVQIIAGGEQTSFVANAGERVASPDQSMRDTQQSFTSANRSNGSMMSPGGAGSVRRSREFGTGNYSDWSQRQRNSEVRSSRKTAGLSTLEPGSGSQGYAPMAQNPNHTGSSWADRHKINQDNGNALPDINSTPGRRRPTGQVGKGPVGAAGFRRESMNSTSGPGSSIKTPGGGFGGGGISHNAGLGTTGMYTDSASKPIGNQTASSGFGVGGGQPPKSPVKRDRGLTHRINATGNSSNVSGSMNFQDMNSQQSLPPQQSARPPLYVPTKRSGGPPGLGSSQTSDKPSATAFKSDLYSQQVPASSPLNPLFGRKNSRGSSGTRFQPPNLQQSTSSGLGYNKPPSTQQLLSSQQPAGANSILKQKTMEAAPVATFEYKATGQVSYDNNKSKTKRYPDILPSSP